MAGLRACLLLRYCMAQLKAISQHGTATEIATETQTAFGSMADRQAAKSHILTSTT